MFSHLGQFVFLLDAETFVKLKAVVSMYQCKPLHNLATYQTYQYQHSRRALFTSFHSHGPYIYIFTVIVLCSRTSTVFPATFSVRRILTDRPTASKSNLSRHVPSGLRGQGQEVDWRCHCKRQGEVRSQSQCLHPQSASRVDWDVDWPRRRDHQGQRLF